MAAIGIEFDVDDLVLTRGRDFKWSFENLNDDKPPTAIDFPAGDLYFELNTGGQHNALQQVSLKKTSGGTYTLAKGAQVTGDIDYDEITVSPEGATPDIQGALEALSNVGAGNVEVHPAQLYPVWEIDLTLNAGNNEKQQILFQNTTGGKFKLSYGLEFTTALDFESDGSNYAAVQTALRALTGIGAGNVNVTPCAGGYQLEFVGSKANTNVAQVMAYSFGVDLTLPTWFFGLTGVFPSVTTKTVSQGTSKFTDSMVNLLNRTLNDFFNTFDSLLGVDIQYRVIDNLNTVLTITSLKAFTEANLVTFAVDVTDTLIEGFLNSVSALFGLFDTIHVDFYWNRVFNVEFIGALANTAIAALVADGTDLTGLNDTQTIEVKVLKPGKEQFTKWHFAIDGTTASLKVENPDADIIPARTHWQLVFLESGEPAGGDPVALGRVRVQGE